MAGRLPAVIIPVKFAPLIAGRDPVIFAAGTLVSPVADPEKEFAVIIPEYVASPIDDKVTPVPTEEIPDTIRPF